MFAVAPFRTHHDRAGIRKIPRRADALEAVATPEA